MNTISQIFTIVKFYLKMVEPLRIELRIREPKPRVIPLHHSSSLKNWSEWQDSNLRHPVPKTGDLPTELHSDC